MELHLLLVEAGPASHGGEVRACCFLLDGQSVIVADGEGRLTWHALPALEEWAELITSKAVPCGDSTPPS